jgi:hypothetical protein
LSKLHSEFYKKFKKATLALDAAKFMQVDSYIHNTLRNAMQQELPFIGEYKLIIKTRILREINALIAIVGIAIVSISCFPNGA